jgi:hypothetical protein
MFTLIIRFIEIVVGHKNAKDYQVVEVSNEDLASDLNESIQSINNSDKAEIIIPAKHVAEHYDDCHSTLSELKALSKLQAELVEFKGNISEMEFEDTGDVKLTLYRAPQFGVTMDALKSALSSTTSQ